MIPFTAIEKLKCAKRELSYRKAVYPRRVEDGRMSAANANHETRLMKAICDDYEKLAAQERDDLFAEAK